jgi:hypothetical protein
MSDTAAAVSSHRMRRTHAARGLTPTERVILAATMSALVVAAYASSVHSPGRVETGTVKVQRGDTLWSIAAAHPVAGLDTARTADLIAQINDLDGAALPESVTILVPHDARNDSVAMR